MGGACPCCAAPRGNAERLYTVTRRDLDGVRYDIHRCPACELLYAAGPVTPDLMAAVYSKSFYASGQQAAPRRADGRLAANAETWPVIANGRARSKWLYDLGLRGRLLDVGAGCGYFVYCASSQFAATGIEAQLAATLDAQRLGVALVHGDAMTHDFGSTQFDVITLWDVFAGFPEPHAALDRFMSLLAPGKHLVMTLPDASSLAARVLRQRWPLMIPPGNLCFYTPRAIAHLLDRPDVAGFEISRHPKRVSVRFLMHKLVRSIGLHRLAYVQWPVPAAWSISLNLHDILTLVVTKR